MAGRTEAVLFDFDYTLVDSSEGCIDASNSALAALGLPQAEPDRIRRTIGLSLAESFRALTGLDDEALAEAYFRHFVARADRVMADKTVLLPGVARAVAVLRARGLRLGIVSTKFRYRIEAILGRDGLLEPFATIVGGEDVSHPKPHPEGLGLALARLELAAEHALYVGDSAVDAEAARRAGVPFAAVLSGTTPRAACRVRGQRCARRGRDAR